MPETLTGKRSFDAVLTDYQSEIYKYALRLTGNPTDADDLYQETFLKAFKAYKKLDCEANVRAWLYRITTNTFLSDRRKMGRVGRLDETMEMTIPAAARDQDSEIDASQLLGEVERFINCLPEKQRIALVLRKYHDLGYGEIAQTLNSSETAARANVYEALQKLRANFAVQLGVQV